MLCRGSVVGQKYYFKGTKPQVDPTEILTLMEYAIQSSAVENVFTESDQKTKQGIHMGVSNTTPSGASEKSHFI